MEEIKQEEPKPRETQKFAKNVILIGGKTDLRIYTNRFDKLVGEGENKIILKAGGRAISRIADIVEMVKRSPFYEIKLDVPKIETELLDSREGEPRKIRVSSMELPVKVYWKKGPKETKKDEST